MSNHPLVLIPALGCDERLWTPVAERLGDEVDCQIIRGEGDSVEALADSVLAQAPQTFLLAGISMGGYVALEIAVRRTGRVRGLALLNTSAIAASEDKRRRSASVIDLVESGDFDRAVELVSGSVAPTRVDVTALAADMARDLGPDVFVDHQRAVMNRPDRTGDLAKIEEQTIVVAAGADAITPHELGRDLADGIPSAELVVLDGIGHLSVLEDPDGAADALQMWLKRVNV